MTTHPKLIVAGLRLLAALVLGFAFASASFAVGPGFSLLRLAPGSDSFAYFAGIGGFGVVGVPIGPGKADTIIQTFGEEDDNGGIAAAVVGHAMRSTEPVVISGRAFDVFVNLDTSRPSLGHMRPGRYTDASFHLFLNVSLVEGGVTVSVLPFEFQVGAIDEPRLPPPAGYPDDPRYPSNGYFGELGFTSRGYPNGYSIHPLVPVPEPGGAALLLAGLIGLGVGARRRRG